MNGQPEAGTFAGFFVVEVVDLDSHRRLAVIDTASVQGGRLTTNSPPFQGVLKSGTYAFIGALPGTSMAMFHVSGDGGRPAQNAYVAMGGGSPAFVGASSASGFAAVPVPPGAGPLIAAAMAIGQDGLVQAAGVPVEFAQVPQLPIPSPIPTVPNWLITLALQNTGIVPSDLPRLGQPCGVALRVAPLTIGGPSDPFYEGNERQLKVECRDVFDGRTTDCRRSTSLLGSLRQPLTGFAFHLTMYRPTGNPIPVDVRDGDGIVHATQHGQGGLDITVQKACLRRVEQRGAPPHVVPQWALPAFARVAPIVVDCPPSQIWDGHDCRQARLTIQKHGAAASAGTVISVLDRRIDCGSICEGSFNLGETVILGAGVAANTNAVFAGWSGNCSGFGVSVSAPLPISGDAACGATFECPSGTA
jgi:hypothetical protein